MPPLGDDDDLFDTPKAKPKPSNKIVYQPPGAQWSLDRLPEVETLYQSSFKKRLPLVNRGQGTIHNKWGYDHRNSADVSINPSSPEGQQFVEQLKKANVPFLAFSSAIPGVATGPHIHIGFPSKRTQQRFNVGARKKSKSVASDDLFDTDDDLFDSGQTLPPTGKQDAGVQPARPSVSPNQSRATSVPTQRYGGIFGRPEVRQAVKASQPSPAEQALRKLTEQANQITQQVRQSQPSPQDSALARFGVPQAERQRIQQTQAKEAAEDQVRQQRLEPQIERLTEEYRKHIRTAQNRGIGPEQWLNETAAKGAAGLTELAASIVRSSGPNPLAVGSESAADSLTAHAQALQRAAEAEGADRNVVSRTIQDAMAGFISTAPEMAAMSLGAPAIPVFAAGSAARSYGRGERTPQVIGSGLHGAATGAAFEIPVSPSITSRLGRAAAKAGTTGAATTGVELATGAPPEKAVAAGITNAAFAGYGQLKHGGRRARKAETQPDVPAQPETAQSTQTSRQDVPARAVVGRGNVEGEPAVRSEPQTPRQWQHSDFGLVTESPNQKKVGKGRVRVVTENGREHIIKEAKLTGAGNQRAIPVKEPPAPNLESGIVETGAPPIRPLEAPAVDKIEGSERSALRDRSVKQPTGLTAAGFKSDLSLSQFVRKMGGIAPGEMYRGELDRIRTKETGTTGLINRRAKQGNVRQTADIIMQAANDAGFRDPATGRPFENPGDFLMAVERDVAGDKIRVRTGDEDFSVAEAEYYAEQESRVRAEDARVELLESGRGAELYDRIDEGKASDAERQEFRNLARERGLSELEIEDIISGDREAFAGLEGTRTQGRETPPAARPAEQLGFVQEGLTQETAPPPRVLDQREGRIREEQDRQAELNPERSAAHAKLAELKRRGLTVDDYARQPDLMGNVPSAEEVAQLRALEGAQARRADPQREYDAALDEFLAVSKRHTDAAKKYRARKIGDEEYLAARQEFDAAQHKMDEAERRFEEQQASVPDQPTLPTERSPEIEARVDRIIKEISDTPQGRTAQFLADEAGGLSLDKFKRAFKGKPSTPVPEGVALAAKRYSELADRMLGLNLKLGDAGGPSPKLSKAEVDALRREHREVLAKMMNVEKFIIDRGYKVNYLGEAAKRDESFPATLRNRPLIEKLKALFRDEEGSLDLDKLRERARQLLREDPDITDEMLKVRLTEPMRGEQASGLEQPKISDARERIRKTRPGEGGFAAVSSPAKTVGPVLREAQRAVQLEPPPVSKRIFAGIKRLPTTLQTALISEFTPLRKLEEAVRGKDVAVDMARKFEQVAGAPAKAEADFVDFKKAVVDPIRQHTDDFNAYLFLKRVEDRLGKDPEGKKVASWTTEKAQQGLKELEQSVGPETMARFEEIGKVYQDEMNRALQLQVESGRMTPELYDKIVNSSDFYAPFKVLKYIEQSEHGGGRNIATTQQLTKKITGIESEDFQVGNILQSSAEQIMRSRVLAEKNLKMQELAKLAETENDLIKKVPTDHHPRPGYEVVRYLENGKPQGLEVMADVAKAISGLNAAQASVVAKWALVFRRGLQWGATGANAGFQVVNLFFADLPRQALVSRYGLRSPRDIYQFPLDWAYSLGTSIKGNFGKPNELFMEWLRSGAANSTVQRELTPEVFRPKPISPGRTHPVRRVLESVADFSNAIEETSKILGLKRALRIEKVKDMTPEQRQAAMEKIAAEIRNYSGSPDFLRRGSETRNMNLLFMFFNARLQGMSSDIRRLAGKTGKPEAVAAWARLGTMVGVPTTVLALVNNLPQYRDDYEKIPDWEKKNYFMIPRESFFRNDDGDMVRDYWRVPKRDIVGLFGNSIESFVAFAAKRDPAKFKDFASSTLESLSPVNIEGENLMERGESVAGSLNPLIKVPIETFSNRDFFRKRPIVPEYLKKASPELQYRKSTPKMYRAAGRALGVSPLRLEHMAEGFTGSGLGQFNIRRQPEGRSPVTGYPIIRRFVRSGAVKQDRSVSATERGIADKQVQRRELRQQMTDQERRGESPDIDSAVASGELTEADRKQIQREAKMSERQARFSDFIPAVALDRFERMDEGQREEVRDQMEKKAYTLLHSDSLTQDQKDAFAARIDALGITPQNPQSSSSSGGFRSRLRGFKSAFRETP